MKRSARRASTRTPDKMSRDLDADQAQALRADLEARDRQPDGKRRAGAHHGRRRLRRQDRSPCAPPARSRCSTASSRSTRKARTTRTTKTAPSCRRSQQAIRPHVEKVTPEQHFTEPPPRYSEASLVRKLEELGIGRPSTYASILSTLRDRAYVRMDRNRFIPEDKGRLVTDVPEQLLQPLCRIRLHRRSRREARRGLGRRARAGSSCCAISGAISRPRSARPRTSRSRDVINALDEILGPHIFPPNARRRRSAHMPELAAMAG